VARIFCRNLFTVQKVDDFVPANHPLRAIWEMLNAALNEMDSLFAKMYATDGRDSIPSERLLRALTLQTLYSVRSERQQCEQLRYNMLFRWFVGISMDSTPWNHSSFTKNRDRLIASDVMRELFGRVIDQADAESLLSKEHFSMDGTMIRAWASHKSFVPRKGRKPPRGGSRSNPEVDFKGTKRTRDTHESTSDLDALLDTKSKKAGAVPAYLGYVLMENRNGLAVNGRLTEANGTAEREAALQMLSEQAGNKGISVGADKAYDHAAFVDGCRKLNGVPHVAQNTSARNIRIDGRTTPHPGYSISQIIRTRIETLFGDSKQHGTLRQVKVRGVERVESVCLLNITTANLRRLARLIQWPATLATG